MIPKEIRRTMRIREGDPLEIYTDNDGEVIFKKYSPIGEMGNIASQYSEVLYKTSGFPAVICDRDHVIAVSGLPKKELLERRVSPALEEMMEMRRSYSSSGGNSALQPVEGVDRYAVAGAPIIAAGDVCGSVLFLSGESGALAGEAEMKLIGAASLFLAKQMEE